MERNLHFCFQMGYNNSNHILLPPMTDTKKRFGKSAWNQHLDQDAAPLPQIDPSDVEALPAPASAPRIMLEVKGIRFMNKENGFVIAYGKALSEPADLPLVWKGRFNKEQVTIKGTSVLLADMGAVGTVIECEGEWVLDPKFGLQYQFTWARECMPSSIEALKAYLSSGRIKGIGPALAKQIVDKWGMDTLKVLDETPQELEKIQGLTPAKIETIKEEWNRKKALYQLTSFFGLYGIGEVWIPKIVEALGDKALEARVRENPYILTTVEGIGFTTADKIALALGMPKASPKRCAAMLLHILEEYTAKQGHTACPVDEWFKDASQQLGLVSATIQPVAQELINKGLVVLRTLPVTRKGLASGDTYNAGNAPDLSPVACVSPKQCFMNERSLATDIKRLKDGIEPLKDSEVMALNKGLMERSAKLDASQIEGVIGVLNNGVSVLTGGPGTGKTTTLKSVIDIAESMGWEVVLAAPTGRAAKRMEEAIGRTARTLHRTLKYSPKEGFQHNRKTPLQGKLFVVDESSMLDNALAASWLRALPNNARVIFVGDIDQLPSVGAGSFLKDIIESNVAQTFRLTRVHRQAEGSLIAEAAQKILAGRMPALDGDPWTDDFAWVAPPHNLTPFEVNEFIQASISSLVTGFLKKGFKKEDIQVLSPQRDGLVGVQGLNDSLRWQLNELGKPPSMEEEEVFALGDRLLVTKNNYDKDVFNGDMGVVKKIEDDGSIELLMEDGKSVILDRAERKSLTLGYAITVHKSQGGEKPVIIMACSPSHTFSMNKNLIYTGITRGKNKVVMVGSTKTLHTALRKQEKMYRLTGLVHEIHQLLPPPPTTTQSFQPKKR